MTVNPNQISVAKIYPGNYTNVLRYWHEEKSVVYLNENGTSQTLTSQPIGGPVGVIFQPGWIAQQAIGYVDLSYQALGSVNQLEYYAQPYGSGLNGSNGSFSSANVIIPSLITIRMFGLILRTVLLFLRALMFTVLRSALTVAMWSAAVLAAARLRRA